MTNTRRGAPDANEVLTDPGASFWLKNAVRSALERDAVDAANDARVLADILEFRVSAHLSQFVRSSGSR